MESTINYDQFKSIISNREVDTRHVRKLIKAIAEKNLLHLNPIICNEQLEVIDGQHRLCAAEALGVPIYFVIDNQVGKQDIAAINSNAKNWNTMDYINYWTIEKRNGFDRLSAFLSENPLIQPSTALMLLSSDGRRNIPALREGVVDVSNYAFAKDVAGILKEYRNYIDFAYDRNFVLAVITMLNTHGYDHEIMKGKIELQPRSLVKCINHKQYVEMLKEIYNYKAQKSRLA
ncbi:ParB N-terminal domain-containing protein [Pedobacter sp. SYP-B3415]|uniref:ParB N-terminal domain-containing protein n=1 Tax=Pedobacter sp. SYP-B3415 TaxID=2496641 RepID=UPI00101D5BBB|nr:ParB N-terminal domain-containing protein [Pedobacter sp. SYP-B3415]